MSEAPPHRGKLCSLAYIQVARQNPILGNANEATDARFHNEACCAEEIGGRARLQRPAPEPSPARAAGARGAAADSASRIRADAARRRAVRIGQPARLRVFSDDLDRLAAVRDGGWC